MKRRIRETLLFAERSIRRSLRTRLMIATYLFQPVLYLFLFTRIFSRFGEEPAFRDLGYDSYLAFFLPGLLVMAALPIAMNSGLAVVVDIYTGLTDAFLRAPIHRSSILAGKLLADASRVATQAVILLSLALLYGAELAGGLEAALVMIALTLVFAMVFAAASNLIALRTKTVEGTSAAATLVFLPLIFASTIMAPAELLPSWMQIIVSLNPVTHVVEASRTAVLNGFTLAILVPLLLTATAVTLLGAAASREFDRAIT